MNEELQKALGELLNKANDGIDAASGFLAAELPDVIQQLLMWHGASNLLYCIIGVVALIFTIKLDISLYKKVKENGDSDALVIGYFMLGSIVRVILYLIIFNYINITWLQIWIAPKVWLLEYAAKLTN